MSRRLKPSIGVLVTALCLGGKAWAHPETTPMLVNRYVTLTVHQQRAEISVALLYGEQPALSLRRRADGNGSGDLDQAEIRRLEEELMADAAGWLNLSLDERAVPFEGTLEVDMGADQEVAASPLVVEARMMVRLTKATHSFRLTPARQLPLLGETEVSCALGPGWSLLPAATGMPAARSHKAVGPLPPGWSVVFDLGRGSPRASERSPAIVMVLLGAAGAVGYLAWDRRMKKKRPGGPERFVTPDEGS